VGTLISTFWILASNSWMQTPQGFALVNGKIVPVDWLKIVFNPSFPYRLMHMAIAAFIVAAMLVSACGAWHLLRGRRDAGVKKSFSMAMWMIVCIVPIQIVVGDAHGINTRKYQPAKIAAIEGLWETEKGGTSLNLVGWPDMQDEVTRYAVKIPHLGSLILTHSWNGEIQGLKDFAPRDRPDSTIVFWTFRIMVGMGFLMLFLGLLGLALRRGGKLYESRFLQRFALLMGPSGLIALLAGWVTTEAGRQPWVVYGVLRTADASSALSAQQVGTSLMIFVIVYFLVFGTGIYYMLKLMAKGPSLGDEPPDAHGGDTGKGRAALRSPSDVPSHRSDRRVALTCTLTFPWFGPALSVWVFSSTSCSTDSISASDFCFPFSMPKAIARSCSTRSHRCGTATRRGWCWEVHASTRRFRWRTALCCQPSICP